MSILPLNANSPLSILYALKKSIKPNKNILAIISWQINSRIDCILVSFEVNLKSLLHLNMRKNISLSVKNESFKKFLKMTTILKN